uniref:CSON012790 protein n=1 Tax=Culicoides sonorensis TaxID=179676 RepID=A0A336K7S0_CULSO
MEMDDKTILGIDFGGSKILVAYYDLKENKCEVILNEEDVRSTPCCLAFTTKGRLFFKKAEFQLNTNPENTIFGRDLKRVIGCGYDEALKKIDPLITPINIGKSVENEVLISVNHRNEELQMCPEIIIAMILSKLKENVENRIHKTISQAVVSVPSIYDTAQRYAMMNALNAAGFKDISLINNTTSAAIRYASENQLEEAQNILIFDMGATSLEIGIFNVSHMNVKTLASNDNLEIGGDSFVKLLFDHFLKEFEEKHKVDIRKDKKKLSQLRNGCEKVKILLSTCITASCNLDNFYDGKPYILNINRAHFERLSESLIDKITSIVKQTINDFKLKNEDIDEYFIIGHGGQVPKLLEFMGEIFENQPLSYEILQDESIAIGAAIYGSNICKVKELLTREISIDSPDNTYVMAKKGAKLPMTSDINFRKRTSWPSYYNIYQNNRKLSSYEGIENNIKSIDINTEVNKHGLVKVTFATEENSEFYTEIIFNHFMPNEEKVHKMKELIQKLDQIDQEYKDLHQLNLDIETHCYSMKRKIKSKQFNDILTEEEKTKIQTKCDDVLSWLESKNDHQKNALDKKRASLNEACESIIAKAEKIIETQEKTNKLLKIPGLSIEESVKLKVQNTLKIADQVMQSNNLEVLHLLDLLIYTSLQCDKIDQKAKGEIYLKRALCKFHMSKFDDAIKDLTEAEDLLDNKLDIWKLRAKCFFESEKLDEAEFDVDFVLNNEDDREMKILKDKILKLKKEKSFAADLKSLERALKLKDYENVIEITDALCEEHNVEDTNIIISLLKGQIEAYFHLNQYENGLRLCTTLIENNIDIFWSLRWRVKYNLALNNHKEVLQDCKKILQKYPNDEEIKEFCKTSLEKLAGLEQNMSQLMEYFTKTCEN